MHPFVRVLLALAVLAVVWGLFFQCVVASRISRDYSTFCDDILRGAAAWTLDEAEDRLETGDVLLILTPVHFVDTVCHVAIAVRTSRTDLAVLEMRKEWMRDTGPCFLTLPDFLRSYEVQPYRLLVRRFRQNGSPLDTDRLLACTQTLMSERYDSVVAVQQINRWLLYAGGLVPMLPQPRTVGRSYCSRAVLKIFIAYGVVDAKTDLERSIFGPFEWAAPAALSRRRFPLMRHIHAGFEVLPFVQINREHGLPVPTDYLEMNAVKEILAKRARHRSRRAKTEHRSGRVSSPVEY